MIVGVPFQVPVSAVSVSPSRAVPEIVGPLPSTDGASAATTAVFSEVAKASPPPFLAVTVTRRVVPTSPGVSL